MNKKQKKKLKQDRQISRNKRNELRRKILENVELHRNPNIYHLLFIENETDNMEKILLKSSNISNDKYLLNIPIITKEMIEKYAEKDAKDLIFHYFGIEAQNISIIEGTNLVIIKDFTIITNKEKLIKVIVRPYNEYTWYNSNCTTTLFGERIFGGKQLNKFFILRNTVNLFTFQDTITEILIYRMQKKKINPMRFITNYSMHRQKKAGNGESHSLALMIMNDETLMRILLQEKEEITELLSPNNQQKLILQKKIKV